MSWLHQTPRALGRYKGAILYTEDLHGLGSIASQAVRAQENRALHNLIQEPAPMSESEPEPEPAPGGALPEWAEELRGCDLPHCPVCALAKRGYLA